MVRLTSLCLSDDGRRSPALPSSGSLRLDASSPAINLLAGEWHVGAAPRGAACWPSHSPALPRKKGWRRLCGARSPAVIAGWAVTTSRGAVWTTYSFGTVLCYRVRGCCAAVLLFVVFRRTGCSYLCCWVVRTNIFLPRIAYKRGDLWFDNYFGTVNMTAKAEVRLVKAAAQNAASVGYFQSLGIFLAVRAVCVSISNCYSALSRCLQTYGGRWRNYRGLGLPRRFVTSFLSLRLLRLWRQLMAA